MLVCQQGQDPNLQELPTPVFLLVYRLWATSFLVLGMPTVRISPGLEVADCAYLVASVSFKLKLHKIHN